MALDNTHGVFKLDHRICYISHTDSQARSRSLLVGMQWRDITAVGPTKKHKLSLGPCLIILMIDSILKYYSPQGLRKLRPFFPKLLGGTVSTK